MKWKIKIKNIEIENHSSGGQLKRKTISQKKIRADLVLTHRNYISIKTNPSETNSL